MFPALFRVLEQYRSWIEGRGAPIMCSAVLTVRCSLDLSFLVGAPNQTVMEVHRMQHQLLGQTMFPQEPKKVHPLLGLFEDGEDVLFPLQVLRDDRAQESEALHDGHRAAEDSEGAEWGDVS